MGEWRAGGGSGSAGIVVRMSVAGVRSWRGRGVGVEAWSSRRRERKGAGRCRCSGGE